MRERERERVNGGLCWVFCFIISCKRIYKGHESREVSVPNDVVILKFDYLKIYVKKFQIRVSKNQIL